MSRSPCPLVLVHGLLVQLVDEQGFLNLSCYCVLLLREGSGFPVYRVARIRNMLSNRGEFRFSHARMTSVFFYPFFARPRSFADLNLLAQFPQPIAYTTPG